MLPQEPLELVKGKAPPRPRRAQPGDCPFSAPSTVSVGARVGGIAQDQVDRLIARLRPDQLAMIGPPVDAPREPQPMVAEEVQDGLRRALPHELVEDLPEGPLDLPVGVELDAAVATANVPNGEQQRQLAAPHLAQPGALQPGLDAV